MEALDAPISTLVSWLAATELSAFMREQSQWTYAALETVHLLGMILVLGAIGVFDLRVLGVAKIIPPDALHRLIPWGVGGFLLSVASGALFVIAQPAQYAGNPAFRLKMLLIFAAGLNILLFYAWAYRAVKATPTRARAPLAGRIITGISLSAWLAVAICGGLVTSGFFG